eukprot:jgi/Mesvir1/13532/Mv16413-RA.1
METGMACHTRKCQKTGVKDEPVLRKAGLCALFADALDRTLSGTYVVPLMCVCAALHRILFLSCSSRAAFTRAGGLDHMTRVLAGATQRRAWELVRVTCECIAGIAMDTAALCCDSFGCAGTFQALVQTIIVSATCADVSCTSSCACNAMHRLTEMYLECCDVECAHVSSMLSLDPALFPALDEHLRRAVDAGDASDINNACRAVVAATQVHVQPVENTRATATDRVCGNLVKVCALAVSSKDTTRSGQLWMLALVACQAVILRVANEEGYHAVQLCACQSVFGLSHDDANAKWFVEHDVVPLVMEAVRQAMERGDVELLTFKAKHKRLCKFVPFGAAIH